MIGVGILESKRQQSSITDFPIGLVAWFPFDAKSGTLVKENVNGINGVMTNCDWVPGVVNGAIRFLSNAKIEVPHNDKLKFTHASGNKPFSITVYVKPESSERSWILQKKGYTATTPTDYELGINLGQILFDIRDIDNKLLRVTSSNTLVLNQWNEVKASFDGSNGGQKVKVNGVLTNGAPTAGFGKMAGNTDLLLIGRTNWTDLYKFRGDLDELKFHDYAVL